MNQYESVDPFREFNLKMTLICQACKTGNFDLVQKIDEQDPEIVKFINSIDLQKTINKIVGIAIHSTIDTIANHAASLYSNVCDQIKNPNPSAQETFAVGVSTAPGNLIIPGMEEKRLYFTADSLKNMKAYLQYLHIGTLPKN